MNPHRHCCPLDFKSSVSTDSTIRAFMIDIKKSEKRGSNPRPQPWQGCALPTELFSLIIYFSKFAFEELLCFSFAVQRYDKYSFLQIFEQLFFSFFYIFFLIYILSGTCIPNILKDSAMISPIFLLKATLKWRLLASSSPKMETL